MKILLIAKPWKGGLGRYFFLALQDMFPGEVEWISTRPSGPADAWLFRRDPEGWWDRLRCRVDQTPHSAAFFVGWRKEFRALAHDPRRVLYLVDDLRMAAGDMAGFGQVFLSDPGYEQDLLKLLPAAAYGGILPFACHPPIHRPTPHHGPRRGVCFIGNRDAKRDPCLERLLASGLPATIVGNYFLKSPLFWAHPLSFRPAVANEAMGRIYARHAASLNIHARVVRAGTNMRTFECAGYGIPQAVEHLPGIETCFEPGQEILFYDGMDAMIGQLRRLLEDGEGARRLAMAARRHALASHTYAHRVQAALGHIVPQGAMKAGFARAEALYAAA